MEPKESFHFGKLSLFNVRLLAALEDARATSSEAIGPFIDSQIEKNQLQAPVSLMHQATFIGHAYVALVWLREALWKSFDENQKDLARKQFESRFNCKTDVTEAVAKNPKVLDLSKPRNVWFLMRNAIAHSRAEIGDDGLWTFVNDDPKEPEKAGRVLLRMEQLGRMCDAALFAYNSVLYTTAAQPSR